MSMMGEHNYFFELPIKQRSDGIFVNQDNYTRELIKKFGLEDLKISKTSMATTTKLDKNEKGKNVDIKLYRSIIDSLLYLTQVGQTLCLVYVCVLDFNLVLKSLTQLL